MRPGTELNQFLRVLPTYSIDSTIQEIDEYIRKEEVSRSFDAFGLLEFHANRMLTQYETRGLSFFLRCFIIRRFEKCTYLLLV